MAASLWNALPQLWNHTRPVVFVVGTDDGKQQTFKVAQTVICELSPVVKTAISGEFREGSLQEIRLQQFAPSDFELFLRLLEVGAFAAPPAISTPAISDMLVLSVVPIAAYLGVQQMLNFMEAHVQTAPTVDTILAFEKCAVDVVWGDDTYECIFANSTNVSSSTRPNVQNQRSGYDIPNVYVQRV